MKNLLERSVTGIAFLIIVIGGIVFSSISFFFVFLLIIVLGLLEFYNMAEMTKSKPQFFLGIVISMLFFLLNFLYAIDYISIKIFLFLIPLLLLVFISEIYRYKKNPIGNIAFTFFGILYICLPISLLNYYVFNVQFGITEVVNEATPDYDTINRITDYFHFLDPTLRDVNYSPWILLGFFIINWSYDTFAYIVGSLLGRRRLSEKISPKKSWEGLIGGAVITFGVAYLLSVFIKDLFLADWFIITFLVIIMSTFGDLIESLFKRSVSLKDSGKIMPGHGGILDRFDGILLSAPMVFVYLEIIKFG